jgi:hypothetical protein
VKKKDRANYVDNVRFHTDIISYHEQCAEAKRLGKQKPDIPAYSSECILLMADRVANMKSFISYSYRDEMIDDAIENCVMYFDRFDPFKWKNPFAYFTTVIQYAFIRRINKEERNRYIIYKMFDTTVIGTEYEALMVDDDNNLVHAKTYDNILDFINTFEEREKRKKEKKAANTAAKVKITRVRMRPINRALIALSDRDKGNLIADFYAMGGNIKKIAANTQSYQYYT